MEEPCARRRGALASGLRLAPGADSAPADVVNSHPGVSGTAESDPIHFSGEANRARWALEPEHPFACSIPACVLGGGSRSRDALGKHRPRSRVSVGFFLWSLGAAAPGYGYF